MKKFIEEHFKNLQKFKEKYTEEHFKKILIGHLITIEIFIFALIYINGIILCEMLDGWF